MEPLKTYLSAIKQNKRALRAAIIATVVFLVLLITLCISIYMQVHIHSEYSLSIQQVRELTYQSMNEMNTSFDRFAAADAAGQANLATDFRSDYAAVRALNTALGAGYGIRYMLLSTEQLERFDAAFADYDAALAADSPTGLATNDLALCVDISRQLVDKHYKTTDDESTATTVKAETAISILY